MLLGAQGLLDDPERAATPASVNKLVRRMGFVQIDSINTIERAHHLILFSRLHRYRREHLAKLLESTRELFEHWTHDASAIPTEFFPHWKHRFERYRHTTRTHQWWQQRMGRDPDRTIEMVKQRIVRDGPLLSRDFEHDSAQHQLPEDGWWGWKPQKAALEHLWRTGELAVTRRINFQKVYDLTERVLPEAHGAVAPSLEAHIEWACTSALDRLGVAAPREIASYWHAISIAQARQWCEQAQKRGQIVSIEVQPQDGSKPRASFALGDFKSRLAKLPDPRDESKRVRLLAPFDPVLRDRQRTQRIFNFEYTLEAFVPAHKRHYGYYVLPMLQGDCLIGRIDPKLHRSTSTLEIRGLWMEPKVKQTSRRMREVRVAIERLADFVGASSIQMSV